MQYIIPPPSEDVIALLQDVDAFGSIILNIEGSNFFGSQAGGFCERKVSITSADDLSGVNFTITGFSNRAGNNYKGVYQSEVITGPLGATVETDNFFSSITSITVDAATTNVSIGSGNQAAILIYVNTISPRFGLSTFSFSIDNPDSLHFNVQGTNHLPTTATLNSITGAGVFDIVADSDDAKYQFPYELAKLYPIVQTMIVVLNTGDDGWVDNILINYIEA